MTANVTPFPFPPDRAAADPQAAARPDPLGDLVGDPVGDPLGDPLAALVFWRRESLRLSPATWRWQLLLGLLISRQPATRDERAHG